MNNLLEIKNINLYFELESSQAQALYDVSLSLNKGETLALVGESGCGKTLTAMSIINLLPKNAVLKSGEILFDGKNLLNLSQNELQKIRGSKIAFIPQDPLTSLNPLFTVGEQIKETIKIHKNISETEAKSLAIEALKAVSIPEAEQRYDEYPHQFSGGMRQRAIIAMALSCSPEMIIADEPTTALDVTIQAQILELIKEVQTKFNTAMLLITHDLGVVAETCQRVVVMYAGRIVEIANVKELFANPLHPYTVGLLNSIPSVKGEKLQVIKGQPPSVTEEISGCPFHPRCPKAFDICKNIKPQLKETAENHFVSCHLYN